MSKSIASETDFTRSLEEEDKRRKDFYWVAGLGGHGVTACFSVGDLAADLVLGLKVDDRFQKALAPERFETVHAS